jgi:hypothetical protein
MHQIPPPPAGDDEHRHLLCQIADELPLQEVVEAAVKAGWKETEVLSALIEVSDNLMLRSASNAELDLLIELLAQRKHR